MFNRHAAAVIKALFISFENGLFTFQQRQKGLSQLFYLTDDAILRW